MFRSEESLSMLSLPDFCTPEMNVVPLTCWQDTCLSKIWIPSRLLTSRREPVNTWATQGVFRTLEKKGHEKQIESFSVYLDDSKSDVFQSDSDEDFNLDSNEKTKTKDASPETIQNLENFAKLQSFPVKFKVSLNEILNSTTEADISNFEFKKPHKHEEFAGNEAEALQSSKKNKNAKKKNKVVKSVTLDKFLEDYTEQDLQADCANSYLQKILRSRNKDCVDDNEVQLNNTYEFPGLTNKKEIEFIKYDKVAQEMPAVTIKGIAETLSQSDINKNICTKQVEEKIPTPSFGIGKFVIENIPSEVPHQDIFLLLSGYGEVKDFSLEPDGDFQKALVEIYLEVDSEWIVECLNGTEAFGASSRTLKCYKQ